MDSRRLRGYAIIVLIAAAIGGIIWLLASGDQSSNSFDDSGPYAVYMAILLVVLLGSLVASRPKFSEVGKAIVIWGGLGLVLVAGYAFKDEFTAVAYRTAAALVPGFSIPTDDGTGSVMVVRGSDRHFHVTARIDGRSVPLMVDTGATTTTLTADDARRAGIDPATLVYSIPIMTANGRSTVGAAEVGPVEVGSIHLQRMNVLVARPGALNTSLLGMDFLGRLKSWTVEGDRLVLTP